MNNNGTIEVDNQYIIYIIVTIFCLFRYEVQLHCARNIANTIITVTNSLFDPEILSRNTILATTTVKSTTDTNVSGRSNNTIFIAVGIGGGITFLVIAFVVVCVFTSLLIGLTMKN